MQYFVKLQAVFRTAEQIAKDAVLGITVDMGIEGFHHGSLRFSCSRRYIVPNKIVHQRYPPVLFPVIFYSREEGLSRLFIEVDELSNRAENGVI